MKNDNMDIKTSKNYFQIYKINMVYKRYNSNVFIPYDNLKSHPWYHLCIVNNYCNVNNIEFAPNKQIIRQ